MRPFEPLKVWKILTFGNTAFWGNVIIIKSFLDFKQSAFIVK